MAITITEATKLVSAGRGAIEYGISTGAIEATKAPGLTGRWLIEVDELRAWHASRKVCFGGKAPVAHVAVRAMFEAGYSIEYIAQDRGVKRRSVLKALTRAGICHFSRGGFVVTREVA